MPDGELQPALGTWEAIDSLRVVREFDPRPLEPWIVERILNAGRRTGSSKNRQRWAFVVCRDRGQLAQLATLGPWAGHLAGAAVAIALVTPDPRVADAPLSITWDLGRVAQNMALAAHSLGAGTCWLGLIKLLMYLPKWRRLFGVRYPYRLNDVIGVGWPAGDYDGHVPREVQLVQWFEGGMKDPPRVERQGE